MNFAEAIATFVTLYVTVSVGFIGFGMLLAGPIGAGRVAAFLFLRPFRYVSRVLRQRLRQLLSYSWYFLIVFVLAPIARQLGRAVGWIVTRERGWLRPR